MDPVRLDREYYLYIQDIHTGYLVLSSHDCVSYIIFKGFLVRVLVRVISHLSIICLIINSEVVVIYNCVIAHSRVLLVGHNTGLIKIATRTNWFKSLTDEAVSLELVGSCSS